MVRMVSSSLKIRRRASTGHLCQLTSVFEPLTRPPAPASFGASPNRLGTGEGHESPVMMSISSSAVSEFEAKKRESEWMVMDRKDRDGSVKQIYSQPE
jgi:hypothetical protein